jgi:hypothetical protein
MKMDHNPKSRLEQICDTMDFLHWIWDRRHSPERVQLTIDKMTDQVGECDYLGELHRLIHEWTN